MAPTNKARKDAGRKATKVAEPSDSAVGMGLMMVASAIGHVAQYAQNAGLESEKEQIRQGLEQWQATARELKARFLSLRTKYLELQADLVKTQADHAQLQREVARLKKENERLVAKQQKEAGARS